MKLFIDLENTVIDEFDGNQFEIWKNIELVKKAIAAREITEINIFSFAIWDEDDLEKFNVELRGRIEGWFGIPVNQVPTLTEIRRVVEKKRKFKCEDNAQFSSIFRKDLAFFIFCQETFDDCEIVLFDDMVEDISFTVWEKRLKINMIGV